MSENVTDTLTTGDGVPSHPDEAQERAVVRRHRWRWSRGGKFAQILEEEETG